jgi:hypothetical protein
MRHPRRRVSTMTQPVNLQETLKFNEATLLGAEAEAVFGSFARHAEAADFLVVNRDGGEPIILLSNRFWLRVLATVAKANDYPIPEVPR